MRFKIEEHNDMQSPKMKKRWKILKNNKFSPKMTTSQQMSEFPSASIICKWRMFG